MDEPKAEAEFAGWAILEILGHRKLAGYVRPATFAGAGVIRIDVPGADGNVATQLYAPSALYCLTPVTEELARRVARAHEPEPVTTSTRRSTTRSRRCERTVDAAIARFRDEARRTR